MPKKENEKIEFETLLTKNKKDVDKWISSIIGEGKECEKSLLTTILLFMKHYMPQHQHTFSRAMSLVLAAQCPSKGRHPKSSLDKVMEQVERVAPRDIVLWYYKAYTLYPDGIKNQAIANVFYKLSMSMDTWPTFIAESPPVPCDATKLFNKEDASPVKMEPEEEFTFY